jgi:hypothetical protein
MIWANLEEVSFVRTLGGAQSRETAFEKMKKRNIKMNLKNIALAGAALCGTVFCTTVSANSVESSNIVG